MVLLVQVTANGIEFEETMYKSLESRRTNQTRPVARNHIGGHCPFARRRVEIEVCNWIRRVRNADVSTRSVQPEKAGGWTLSESVSGWCETAGNYYCRFLGVEICPNSNVTRVTYSKQAVTQKLVSQGEYIHRATRHTGSGRYPSNQDETGSVLRLR